MDELQWMIAREIPHLRRFARALTRETESADDLVQDCLERALKKRHLWRREGSLRSWLLRMLYNVYLNKLPARRRDGASVPLDEFEHASIALPAQEHHVECRAVADALDLLPSEQRDAILLVALEGTPYDEAAWTLGIPVGTLRSRLSRGREALRRLATIRRQPGRLRTVK